MPIFRVLYHVENNKTVFIYVEYYISIIYSILPNICNLPSHLNSTFNIFIGGRNVSLITMTVHFVTWQHAVYFVIKENGYVHSLIFFDNEIIFISIETFTHSYIHDKQWKYRKVKKSWTLPVLHQYITAALNQLSFSS